jgi:hypothetical protein
MKPASILRVLALTLGGVGIAYAQQPAAIDVEFTNAKLIPPHWHLSLNAEGSGQFEADAGEPTPGDNHGILVGAINRPIHLSPEFTSRVFAVARQRKLFAFPCESHMKVAQQGIKRLSYSGPEGSGACEYNYSKDKEIQSLGESFIAVQTTLIYGARLEKMLQHDRLGLDLEIANLVNEAHQGTAIELGTIHETLTRLAEDDQVLERVRKRARLLLADTH